MNKSSTAKVSFGGGFFNKKTMTLKETNKKTHFECSLALKSFMKRKTQNQPKYEPNLPR